MRAPLRRPRQISGRFSGGLSGQIFCPSNERLADFFYYSTSSPATRQHVLPSSISSRCLFKTSVFANMSAMAIKSHPGLKTLEEVDTEMYELIEQEKRRQVRLSPRAPPATRAPRAVHVHRAHRVGELRVPRHHGLPRLARRPAPGARAPRALRADAARRAGASRTSTPRASRASATTAATRSSTRSRTCARRAPSRPTASRPTSGA